MPGPMSTPKYWGDKKRNTSGNHGLKVQGPRESGKTDYDHNSGKWQRHLAASQAKRSAGLTGREAQPVW